jgi:hypothetical protein
MPNITSQNLKEIRAQADKYDESRSFMQRQRELASMSAGEIMTLDEPRQDVQTF